MYKIAVLSALLLVLAPAVATAQTGISPKAMPREDVKNTPSDDGAPGAYVARGDTTKFCFERPTKSSAPCVLPKGSFQLESDIGNWTVSSYAGVRTDTIEYINPTLKYGLGDYTDIEANIAPYVDVRTRDDTRVSHLRGVGDLTLRLKHRLTNPNRTMRYAVVAIVKVPTAKLGIGNGQLEGGGTAPVVVKLQQGFALTFSPEADLLADNYHPGRRHLQIVMAAVLQKPVTSKLTAFGELWTSQNHDPSAHIYQYSADLAVGYMLTPKVQIDLGELRAKSSNAERADYRRPRHAHLIALIGVDLRLVTEATAEKNLSVGIASTKMGVCRAAASYQ